MQFRVADCPDRRNNASTLKTTALILFACASALTWPTFAQNQTPTQPEKQTVIAPQNRELLQRAIRDFDKKNYDDALKALAELDQKMPNDPLVLNLMGAAYTRKKDFGKAEDYFKRSLEKAPDFFPSKFNVGELLFLQKRYAEALDFFGKMLATSPRNELLQFKVFLCQLQLGRDEEAAKTLSEIKYPGDTPAWYYAQAALEHKKGHASKASEYIKGARFIFGPKTALFDETFEDLQIK